ncbi:MAG: hypothetical protein Q9194_006561, partial [Teloschistes cf. exilis]
MRPSRYRVVPFAPAQLEDQQRLNASLAASGANVEGSNSPAPSQRPAFDDLQEGEPDRAEQPSKRLNNQDIEFQASSGDGPYFLGWTHDESGWTDAQRLDSLPKDWPSSSSSPEAPVPRRPTRRPNWLRHSSYDEAAPAADDGAMDFMDGEDPFAMTGDPEVDAHRREMMEHNLACHAMMVAADGGACTR